MLLGGAPPGKTIPPSIATPVDPGLYFVLVLVRAHTSASATCTRATQGRARGGRGETV